MRVVFAGPFEFSPRAHGGRVTIVFRKGWTGLVTHECANAAQLAGALGEDPRSVVNP